MFLNWVEHSILLCKLYIIKMYSIILRPRCWCWRGGQGWSSLWRHVWIKLVNVFGLCFKPQKCESVTTDNGIRQRWECDFNDFEVSQAFQNTLQSGLKAKYTHSSPTMTATRFVYRFVIGNCFPNDTFGHSLGDFFVTFFGYRSLIDFGMYFGRLLIPFWSL